MNKDANSEQITDIPNSSEQEAWDSLSNVENVKFHQPAAESEPESENKEYEKSPDAILAEVSLALCDKFGVEKTDKNAEYMERILRNESARKARIRSQEEAATKVREAKKEMAEFRKKEKEKDVVTKFLERRESKEKEHHLRQQLDDSLYEEWNLQQNEIRTRKRGSSLILGELFPEELGRKDGESFENHERKEETKRRQILGSPEVKEASEKNERLKDIYLEYEDPTLADVSNSTFNQHKADREAPEGEEQ